MKNQDTYSLTIGKPFSPTKWWNAFATATASFIKVNAYQNGQMTPVSAPLLNVFTAQTFSLPRKCTFELSGFFNSGGFFGAARNGPFGAANAAFQKKFGKNGGSLSLGVDNFLNTMIFKGNIELPEQNLEFRSKLQFDFPTVKLTFSQNFGNSKAKSARKRTLGSEEERKRVD